MCMVQGGKGWWSDVGGIRDGWVGGGSKWMVEWEGEDTDEKEDPSQLLSRD